MKDTAPTGPDDGDAQRRLGEAEAMIERSPLMAEELLGSLVDDFKESEPGWAARAAYLSARLAVMAARPRAAIDRIEQARDLFGMAGMPVAQARTDLGRINVLNELGLHRQAVKVGLDLMAELDRMPAQDEEVRWMLAGAAENTGASNGWLGRHGEALAFYERARNVYSEIGEPIDEARVSANRGVELIELGRHGEALTLLAEAEAVFEAESDDLSSARCLAYAAKGHAQAGRYGASVDTLALADTRLGRLEQSQDHLRTSLVWAEVYAVLNLTDEALARCNTLIPRFEESGMTRDAGLAELVKATVLVRSNTSGSTGNHDAIRATATYGGIEAAQAAVAAAERRFEAADLPAMTARCYLLQSELAEPRQALLLAERAYQVLNEAGHATEAAEAALRCAELTITSDAGVSVVGRDHLQLAADLIAQHELNALSWRLHFLRGRQAEQRLTPQAATAHYDSALAALRELRSSIGADALRIPFMGGRRIVQEALVELLLRLHDVDGAAAVTESERAETLVGRLASPSGGSGPSETGPDATITYQTLGEEIVCFVRRAGDSEPRLIRTKMTVPEIEGLLRKLDAQWRRFEDPRLSAHHETLRRSTERLLQDLYLGLFEPTEVHLDPGDSIMVAPAGVLGNVPFHALHNGLAHLVDSYEFSITPSVTVAGHVGGRFRGEHTVVIGVADDAAPQILPEAEHVAALTGGTLLLDQQATSAAVRAEAERADVIHLATHGRFRPDNPWFSAIRLADGWLRALDIERWDLSGSLVVLAACRSGQQSAMGGGDELLGIPRACLAAGAAAVIVNLWPVDDRQSVGLMTGLHQHLRNETPVTALRSAQRSTMADAPHPYHWAPAILYGARQSGGPSPPHNRKATP